MMQYPPIMVENDDHSFSFNVDQQDLDALTPVIERMLNILEGEGREFLNPTVKLVILANLLVSYAGALYNEIQEDENNSKEEIMSTLYTLLWDYCRQAGENIVKKCI